MRFSRLFVSFLAGLLLSACATPSPEEMKATFQSGLADYDAGNYEAAYKKWKSISDVDVAAMWNVALMLRTGKGVAKDPKAAQAMMAAAAAAGLVKAQADLGDMLLKGEAGPPDARSAFPWLAMAAEAGHPVAAFQLAQLYEEGVVVGRNLETARKLYQLAAAAGVPGADARLAALPQPAARSGAPPANPPAAWH